MDERKTERLTDARERTSGQNKTAKTNGNQKVCKPGCCKQYI